MQRWGTTSVADIEAAARLTGPSVAVGEPVVVAAMIVACVAAIVDEARGGGLRAASMAERAVGVAALAVLVPLFLAPGPESVLAAGWWAGAAASVGVTAWLLSGVAARVPWWGPVVVAAGSTVVVGAARCTSC